MPRWMAVALFLLACTGPLTAQEWKAGFARAKITPEQPIPMSGYGGRTKPFEKVAADLYAKALVLEENEGRKAAIVTSDLLGFSAAVAEPICARLMRKLGWKREQILLTSSHTHAGPLLSVKGDKDAPAEMLRVVEYTRWLQDQVVAVVEQAAGRMEPVRLSWGGGVAQFVMNRREFTPTGIILGNNPRGLADRTVPVLRIDGPDGKLRAVLFGAAVHNTTLGGDNYQICGDYAGFAQAHVEQKLPGVQAMFFLGCAGDANPYPRGTMEIARQHGAALGEEVCRVLQGKLKPAAGKLAIGFEQLDLPLQASLSRAELTQLADQKRFAGAGVAKQLLALLERGEKLPASYRCPVTVWQLGELTLVGLSGEVVVDYVPLLEKALGPNNLWVAAYCNDVFGYLPSAHVLAEGGYETRGLYAGGVGFFAPAAQDVLVRKVADLAKSIGRK